MLTKLFDAIKLSGSTTESIYSNLLNCVVRQPNKQHMQWMRDLKFLDMAIRRGKHYVNNYLATNETKQRSFQIKLHMRAIVINIQFHGLEIKDSDKCMRCYLHRETLLYLFFLGSCCIFLRKYIVRNNIKTENLFYKIKLIWYLVLETGMLLVII